MTNHETAAQALVQYIVCREALREAEYRLTHGPGENQDFWFKVQILIADRLNAHRDTLKSVIPSGQFEHRRLSDGT